MPRSAPTHPIRQFAGNTQGNVALLFGMILAPMLLVSGAGVDYARAAMLRTALQNTVDSAALAGAAAYSNSSYATVAQTLSTNYVTNGTNSLLSQLTLGTTTVTPGTLTTGGAVTAYTMTVATSATVPTTLMAMFTPTMTVHAAATAKNPIVTATVKLTSWKASACDTNTAYWYAVPANNVAPAQSAMTQMFTNSGTSNPSSISIFVSASQKIGFAFKSVTGGQCPYGSNQYGGAQGSIHWFYSSQTPPNAAAYGATATKDCSLQVVLGTVKNGNLSFTAPKTQCLTASSSPTMSTALLNAAPSCSALNGGTYQYSWNDMGGGTDSLNYDDGVYTLSCTGGSGSGNGTATTGVVLTN
jgi:Flp pilus assembly protein TadG